ncbi:MAG TPA: radical SAM protein [Terriglobales bacterium]|nr:radical SAM protein [Terriglobales bacterium]
MSQKTSSLRASHLIKSWGGILTGRAPLMSIEITRECPLSCPGCYAYNDTHLGGETNLRDLSDFKGDELVQRVIALVKRHRPLHVSLVGGEPMMRHRELNQIIPALNDMGVFTMVVTSGVIPIPPEWMKFPAFRCTISVDGLPEHHDIRRKPATYERILRNIQGCEVNVHWTITHPMVQRPGYLEEYVKFWAERPEVNFIWVSYYSPQAGEQSAEMLTPQDREVLLRDLPPLRQKFPKFLVNRGIVETYSKPPRNPDDCIFSTMSVNYTADMKTRVEPCIFGGNPDCSQCGCAISVALEWVKHRKLAGPLTVGHLVRSSVKVGKVVSRLKPEHRAALRWERDLSVPTPAPESLVQIASDKSQPKEAAAD